MVLNCLGVGVRVECSFEFNAVRGYREGRTWLDMQGNAVFVVGLGVVRVTGGGSSCGVGFAFWVLL